MESPKEGREECGSSESGWTMYIASSVHEDYTYSGHHDDDHFDDNGTGEEGADSESNDSMASDASSGPSRPEVALGYFEHSQGQSNSKSLSGKRSCKLVDKQMHQRRIKEEKQVTGHKPNRAASHSHSGANRGLQEAERNPSQSQICGSKVSV